MVTEIQERVTPIFAGSPDEQALAGRIFELVRAQGRFMSADAPIRVSVASIAAFLSAEGDGAAAGRIEDAIAANPGIFALEELNGERMVITTRGGTVPRPRTGGVGHSFAQRFMTPLPKPETPAEPVRERPRIDPSWATLSTVLEGLEPEPDEEELVAAEAAAAAATPEVVEVAPPAALEPVESVESVDELEPAPTPAPARTITLPSVARTDVTGVDDMDLAAALADRLRADIRVANFGDQWMIEDRVPRFSRGDLRRMKDYIQEQEQPLTDDVLVQDVLGVRPGSQEFDLMRFAVNFRLSREHREFDFVGTANQRFWSTTNLPQIGTTRRKPNEIGTDYRFLLDESPPTPAYRTTQSVDHVLTFYEYYHGLLPYDAQMQALLPGPLQPNQRSAVLTLESPQSYTTYLVELRYPTPNRGGFILGLDDLYTENLVPGALLSITATANDGHYLIEYVAAGNQNARLLELDERRAQRYVFRPTTFACGVDDAMLLTEERFPRLGQEKPLDEKVRRRPEAVVAVTFERIGEKVDGGFSSTLDALLAAVNVERPFSPTLLRSILDNDDTGAFSRDPDGADVYTYVPGTTS